VRLWPITLRAIPECAWRTSLTSKTSDNNATGMQAVRSDCDDSEVYMDLLTLLLLGSEISNAKGLEGNLALTALAHAGAGGFEELLNTACGVADID
jgi:hypothetical protein